MPVAVSRTKGNGSQLASCERSEAVRRVEEQGAKRFFPVQGVTDKMQGTEIVKKQKTGSFSSSKSEEPRDGANEADMDEVNFPGSEEMELGISHIHERVERFNQLVSELLENGKLLFSKLSNDFEERVLMIHREQIEKWQEEMKELRMLDSNNEEMNSCLENAKCVLQSVHGRHAADEC